MTYNPDVPVDQGFIEVGNLSFLFSFVDILKRLVPFVLADPFVSGSYTGECYRWLRPGLDGMTSFLDVGCGTGWTIFQFRKLFSKTKFVGIDLSYFMLGCCYCTQHYLHDPEPTFKQCDVEKALPFEDKSFDVVWSSHTLEHMKDPMASLKEMARIGKTVLGMFPNGLFADNAHHLSPMNQKEFMQVAQPLGLTVESQVFDKLIGFKLR